MDSRSDVRTNWQAESGLRPPRPGERPTHWGALLVFAGVMLGVVGLFHAMAGFTALLDDEVLVVRAHNLVVSFDYAVWGWVHLLVGLVALVASYLLLRGNIVGRALAVGVAVLSMVVDFAFLPAQPWWSALGIVFNVVIVYAITAHGAELKDS
jgi:hypothetical protein